MQLQMLGGNLLNNRGDVARINEHQKYTLDLYSEGWVWGCPGQQQPRRLHNGVDKGDRVECALRRVVFIDNVLEGGV